MSESAQQFLDDNGVDVVVAKLDVPDEALVAARALLSPGELERADRFVFERDRNRYVVARATLRKHLGERLGIQPAAIEFSYGPSGKPALAGQPAGNDLRFNVSHCGDVAVYVFARGRDIGVDVEAVTDLPDRDDVAAHCFSIAEQQSYRALDEDARIEAFFNCWTRKEALVKAMGDGLGYPLDKFDVTLAPDEPARILSLGSVPGNDCGWEMHAFEPLPGFVAAVVIEATTC